MPAPPDALGMIDQVMAEVVRRTPGSFVERKGASLAWHYRMSEPLLAARRLDELRRRIAQMLPDSLEILDGNKVLEVRMRGADKRAAAQRIVAREATPETAVIAIGDDRTDEDLFGALPPDAITIRVGPGSSRAHHRVDSPDEVRVLLRGLQ
jgi:trehalose 6-phosphate synthase/phosphatase